MTQVSESKVAKLVIRTRGGSRYEFPLDRDVTIIGRGHDCDLIIDGDRYASRHHARVERAGDRWNLVDQESRNGTSVGGRKMVGPHRLRDGDEIQIGDTILFYVERSPEDDTGSTLQKSVEQARSLIQVDFETWEVAIEGERLEPRPSVLEFKLLACLYNHADKVCSRDDLCSEIWGEGAYTYEMLHTLVHRVKRRIEPEPEHPRYIISVPGVGYRLACS